MAVDQLEPNPTQESANNHGKFLTKSRHNDDLPLLSNHNLSHLGIPPEASEPSTSQHNAFVFEILHHHHKFRAQKFRRNVLKFHNLQSPTALSAIN
jgi:hypothetical protein